MRNVLSVLSPCADKRWRPYLPFCLAVIVLAATIAAVNVQAATAAPRTAVSASEISQAWSSVPEFPSAPALASGQVVDAGTPVTGATVILFPVPVPVSSGVGAKVTVTPLARTTTDSNGRFVVRLPASSDTSLTNVRSGGALNLHVMAFYPSGIAQWYYSLPSAKSAATSQPTATLVLHHTPGTASTAAPGGYLLYRMILAFSKQYGRSHRSR
jgi:hypothetical protein